MRTEHIAKRTLVMKIQVHLKMESTGVHTMTVADESTAVAAATGDASASSTSRNNESDDPRSVKAIVAAMNKHSDGTNLVRDTIASFSMINGSVKKGDVMIPATEPEIALELLKELVEDAKTKARKFQKKNIWEFRTSPHEQFEKTLSDTFKAFLKWASTNGEDQNSAGKDKKKEIAADSQINVSKAFRRLEQYASWMEDTDDNLTEPTLTAASYQKVFKIAPIHAFIDKEGHVVVWVDAATIDLQAFKTELNPKDVLRSTVWFLHYLIYDANTQDNGFVQVINYAQMGFIQAITLLPMKLISKLNHFALGAVPFKLDAFYVLESAMWFNLLLGFMRIFVGKELNKRLVILKEWEELEKIVGKECIPKGFGKLEGNLELEVDLVQAKYGIFETRRGDHDHHDVS